jgi:hypothetical protein
MATTTTQRREKTIQDKIAEAKVNYSYIRVPSANKGKTKSGPLVLSGAKNRWEAKGEKNFIYQPTLRMAGTVEEFRAWLQHPSGGQQQGQQVEVYIQNSFRWDNHNSNDAQIMIGNQTYRVKEAFDAEIANLKAFRNQQKSVAANEPKLDLNDLTVLLQSLDLGQAGAKVVGAQGTVAKKGRTTDVASKFANLAADKVLDVTSYTATGTGARTIPKPAQGSNKAVLDPTGQHAQLSRAVFDFTKSDRTPAINFLMALGYPQDQAVAYLTRVAPQTMIPVVGGAAMPQSFPSNNFQAPRIPSPQRTMSPPRTAPGGSALPLPSLPSMSGMGGVRSPMPSMPGLPGLASPARNQGGLPTLPSLSGMGGGALPALPGMGNF